jgi:ferric-dicitrate binding protein FerR (iron transport regulator)
MIQRTVDAQTVISWQHGDLSFNNERLADVCAVLSKKYRLQFHFRQAEIKNYRVTAGFISNEKISDILSILASANGLSYEQQDRTVTFKKRSR